MNPANESLLRDYERSRRAAGLKARPNIVNALHRLERHCNGRDLATLTRGDIQGWAADGMSGLSPGSRLTYFAAARAFYAWAAGEDEGIMAASPMARLPWPRVPVPPMPMPEMADVRALLAATEADKTPAGLRDAAMIRLMADTGGPRASEVAGMLIAGRPGAPAGVGLNLDRDTCSVVGKGDKHRTWPLSAKTARAAARWIRARDRIPGTAGHARLWVGFRGPRPVTYAGVEDMLARRARAAGLEHLNPHKLRHYAYHHFRLAGGGEGDAMLLFGWDDPAMARRYARDLAAGRALTAGFALAIGDQW